MCELAAFFDTANGILVLLTGLIGLIGTSISTFFAIRNWVKALKEKTSKEQWELIMEMADAAMTEAEASHASSETKKQMVIDTLTAATKAAGIDIQNFAQQLSLYIDQTIKFVNKMKTS
jgi:hypothetical protein